MIDGVGETQHIGVKTKSSHWIISVSILDVAAHWMPQVGTMDADLVLSTRFQLEFHQGVSSGAIKHMEVGDGVLASIING